MMALRRTFVENRKKIKVQMEHYSAKATIKQADREIKHLSERITQIEKEIFNLIDSEPELKQKFDILKTMPCIGKIVAATIVIECPELEESKPDEIYALAGVVPLNCDSGKMRGRRKIRGGRQIIRTVLFTSAMSAVHIVKEDNVLKQLYNRIIAKGKAKKTALLAVVHKMLKIAHFRVKNKTNWINKITQKIQNNLKQNNSENSPN